ncbi:hypothetical protein ACL598_17490 [Bordetella bronchialis]|uniref:hypothetical protein n=1 Tax=Bordetella bronchialis TaxID=463025 RepID=UPI003D0794F2
MNKTLGPTFGREIADAGLSGVPFFWDTDFNIEFNDDVPQDERAAVQAVIDAHDPTKQLVPQTVTRYQGRAALLAAGLLDTVTQHFAEVAGSDLAKLAWNEAPTFERDSPLVIATAAALSLTEAQLDDLFIAAAQVK